MKKYLLPIVALALFAALAPALDRESAVGRLQVDVAFLASDACEGRGPGTAGIDKAADHIAAAFRAAGLKGAMPDGSFFQPFTVRGTSKVGKGTGAVLQYPGDGMLTSLTVGDQLQPIGLSGTGDANGQVV